MCEALMTSCDQKPSAKAMAHPLTRQTSGPVLVSRPHEKRTLAKDVRIDGLMPLRGHNYCCGKDMLSWIV